MAVHGVNTRSSSSSIPSSSSSKSEPASSSTASSSKVDKQKVDSGTTKSEAKSDAAKATQSESNFNDTESHFGDGASSHGSDSSYHTARSSENSYYTARDGAESAPPLSERSQSLSSLMGDQSAPAFDQQVLGGSQGESFSSSGSSLTEGNLAALLNQQSANSEFSSLEGDAAPVFPKLHSQQSSSSVVSLSDNLASRTFDDAAIQGGPGAMVRQPSNDSIGSAGSVFSDISDLSDASLTSSTIGDSEHPFAATMRDNTRLRESTDILEKAGIDINGYSRDFLASPDVVDALKKKLGEMPALASGERQAKDIKSALDELNVKHMMDKPLHLSTDLSRTENLSPVLEKVLAGMPEGSATHQSVAAVLDLAQQNPHGVSREFQDKAREALGAAANDKSLSDDVRGAAQGLQSRLDATRLVGLKESMMSKLEQHFENLNASGGKDYALADASLGVAVAPAVEVFGGGTRSAGVERNAAGNIDRSSDFAAYLGAAGGVEGLASGGGYVTAGKGKLDTYADTKQMVSAMADHVLSLAEGSAAKAIAGNGLPHGLIQDAREVSSIVKAQNGALTGNDKLSDDLHRLGWLPQDVELKIPEGHNKPRPLSEERTHTIGAGVYAEAGVGDATAGAGSEWSRIKSTVTQRSSLIDALSKDKDLLAIKERLHNHDPDLESLKQRVDSVVADPVNNADEAQVLASELRDKIKENFGSFESYSADVRSQDNYTSKSFANKAGVALRKAMHREQHDPGTQRKLDLQKQLGTNGRTETLAALTTQHASYAGLYGKLDESAKLGDAQFKDTLSALHSRYQAPDMVFSDKQQGKFDVAAKTTAVDYERNSYAEMHFNGQKILFENTSSDLDGYPNKILDGETSVTRATVQGGPTVEMLSFLGMEMDTDLSAASDALGWRVGADGGLMGGFVVERESKDGHELYTRVKRDVGIDGRGGLDIPGIGGLSAEGAAHTQSNVWEKMGDNSTNYSRIQFMGMSDAGRVGADGSNDGWRDFAQSHAPEFATIVQKFGDESSNPHKELRNIVDQINAADPGVAADMNDRMSQLLALSGSPELTNSSSDVFAQATDHLRAIYGQEKQSVTDPEARAEMKIV